MSVRSEIVSAVQEVSGPKRQIVTPAKGSNGLFQQTREAGPDREIVEQHNRDRFASHFKFADPYTGLTRTYDEVGDYNCGRCNQAKGDQCLLVKIDYIDRVAGSCGDWENLCAGDPEMLLKLKNPTVASYGVRKGGKPGRVFGCHQCPYASKAYAKDSRGRDMYCGKGDFRTYWNACCSLNGAETVKT